MDEAGDFYSLDAWMSQVYIASISRGDQSRSPFLHASLTAEMNDPVKCAILLDTEKLLALAPTR